MLHNGHEFICDPPVPESESTLHPQTSHTLIAEHPKGARWPAEIDLAFTLRNGRSVMSRVEHKGPLRVQRAFQESDGSCHVYLLHPPGGVVGGDSLEIKVSCDRGTDVVLTSPAAGKFYRCATSASSQVQNVAIHVDEAAHFEWLPQETIFFNGASAQLKHEVRLAAGASYLGWEIFCLGRKASGETFDTGHVVQATSIFRDDRLLHRERIMLSDETMKGAWSLQGQSITGTFVATVGVGASVEDQSLSSGRVNDRLRGLINSLDEPNWGVTAKGGVIVVRYLGGDIEQCREGFEYSRSWLTDAGLFNVQGRRVRPRIWNT